MEISNGGKTMLKRFQQHLWLEWLTYQWVHKNVAWINLVYIFIYLFNYLFTYLSIYVFICNSTLCAAPALQTASETPKIAFAPSLAEISNKEQTHDTFRSSCYRPSTAGDVEKMTKLFSLFTCRPLYTSFISASQYTK